MAVEFKNGKMENAFFSCDIPTALSLAEERLKKDINDVEALYVKTKILCLPLPEYNNPGKAYRLIYNFINSNIDVLKGWLIMAELLNDSGEFCESAECYRRILDMDSKNYEAIIGLASLYDKPFVYVTETHYESLLKKAIEINPTKPTALVMLAEYYFSKKRLKESLNCYKESLDKLDRIENPALRKSLLEETTKRINELESIG